MAVTYHGHELTVVYDKDGSKYKLGKGVTVFLDGKRTSMMKEQNKYRVVVGKPIIKHSPSQPENYALNIWRKGYPVPSASINSTPDSSMYQAIDGRIWYFPEITNRWTTEESTSQNDWYAIDFGEAHELSSVKLYLFADNKTFAVPDAVTIEYKNGGEWIPVKLKEQNAGKFIGNTVTRLLSIRSLQIGSG